MLIAHRGLNRKAPENTLAAFRAAARAGVPWIETDVDLVSDGTAVIIHDTTVDRTTDGTGSIYDLDLAALKELDAGSWFHPDFHAERIPTLYELIELVNEERLNLNLELKPHETGAQGTLRLVDTVLEELTKLDEGRQLIVSSFSALTLRYLHEQAPHIPVAMLWEGAAVPADWLSVLEMVGVAYVHLPDEAATPAQIRSLTDRGYKINVWTVNDGERAEELFDLGVTGIFSDVADELLGERL